MNNLLQQLKNEAKDIKVQKRPKFYDHFAPELAYARETFFDNPLILRCAEDVLPFLYDNFGHGVEHCKTVAIEAGTIVFAEAYSTDLKMGRHLVVLAQLAGLLHDTCRLERDHAQQGAELSMKILQDYPLADSDKAMIFFAIRNHEAFRHVDTAPDFKTELLSGALYDADKFRWGPDNFVTTLWEICDYEEWTLDKIVSRFPQGMEFIQSIADTFRTQTGQLYGPEFIETGLEMGNTLYRRMKQFCS